jgi:hypothetical protein
VIEYLGPQDEFEIIAHDEVADWYQIATSGGQTGWVAAAYVAAAPDVEIVQPPANKVNPEPLTGGTDPDAANSTEDEMRDIEFGDPVTFETGLTSVLATNTTEKVMSFVAKATYMVEDTTVATAVGVVKELLPGQTRAVPLVPVNPIPDTFDSVRVSVDTMISESEMADGATVAPQIAFGEPVIGDDFGLEPVRVAVTNNGRSIRNLTIQAIALVDEELVGVASGAVNQLFPGHTITVTLTSQGAVREHDLGTREDTDRDAIGDTGPETVQDIKIQVAVETVLQ